MLDFDGTMAAIALRPNNVRVAPAMGGVLRRLAKRRQVAVTVISGRRRAELQRLLRIRGIHCRGLYGWEKSADTSLPMTSRRALRSAHRLLSQRLRLFPGLWIEDKRFSLSVHLQDVPGNRKGRARREIHKSLRSGDRRFRIFENLRDVEILPRAVNDKGAAVREILKESKRHSLAVYFGDDFSDEPAFQAARKGVTVHAGRARPTSAKYRVRGPAEVALALLRLEEALG